MTSRPLLVATIVVAACVPAELLAKGETSWGKAGVPRREYDADAIACAHAPASRSVAGDPETERYLRGFEVLEQENNAPPLPVPAGETALTVRSERQVLLRRMYAPDRKVDQLQAKLQGEVEACLARRGYARFRLTKEQARRLRRLPPATDERRRYLHGLASDPVVLQKQLAP